MTTSIRLTSPYNSQYRSGKTQRDHESGSWARRFKNREARGDWSRYGGVFPVSTCNGKKNRYQYTGKGGSLKRVIRNPKKNLR